MQAVSGGMHCFCNFLAPQEGRRWVRLRSSRSCLVVVYGGKRFFPDGVGLNFKLIEERPFHKGGLVLRDAVRR